MNHSHSMLTSLMEDVTQTLEGRKTHAQNKQIVIKPEMNRWFLIRRFVLSWFFPEYNNFNHALKMKSLVQNLVWMILAGVAVTIGSYHACSIIMPWFEHVSPVLHQASGLLSLFFLVVLPVIVMSRFICTARDKWSEKLEDTLQRQGPIAFEYLLYKMATRISPVIYDTLLFKALKEKELESYRVLLEFNDRYQVTNLKLLGFEEHERQYQQVEVCYDKNLFMVEKTGYKVWMDNLERYSRYANRQTYDFIKLCLRESTAFRRNQGGNLKNAVNQEEHDRFIAFFQYMIVQYELDKNRLITKVFQQCLQLNQYQTLLDRHALKNRLENEFNSMDEEVEDPVSKI
jgi:hypothetical protein